MSVEDNKRTVRRLFDEVWNERRLEPIEELYARTVVIDYRPYSPLQEGHDAVRGMVERSWASFPDYHEELLGLVAEDNRVAVHLLITGTQHGAWGPVPPTGRHLEFEEMLFLTFDANARVVHQRGIADNILGLRQAGVIPTPEP